MRSRYKKIGFALVALIAASVAAISAASGSSVNITPAGDNLLATATKLSVTVNSATITCEGMETAGTIHSPAEGSMKLDAPVYPNKVHCASTGLGGEEYTPETGFGMELKANSTTSGSLVVPEEGIRLAGTSGCLLRIPPLAGGKGAGNATLSGTWTDGKALSPLAQPATLNISGASVTVRLRTFESCPKALKEGAVEGELTTNKGKLSTNIVVADASHLNEPVEFK